MKANLELVQTSEINHATGFGRIAFSIPTSQLEDLQKSVEAASGTILARLVSLDTPGKATVSVVILADPVILCILNGLILASLCLFSSFSHHNSKIRIL